jgi:hypothetical protein
MNDSTILIGVVKGGQLGLKGRSIPNMKLPLFYKREKQPDSILGACKPVNFAIFKLNEAVWKVGKRFDILIYKRNQIPILCYIFNSSGSLMRAAHTRYLLL